MDGQKYHKQRGAAYGPAGYSKITYLYGAPEETQKDYVQAVINLSEYSDKPYY